MFNKTIIVMDGSDLENVYEIIAITEMLALKWFRVKMESLDANHPTMKVIKFKATKADFEHLQEIIEELYPGLCIFM